MSFDKIFDLTAGVYFNCYNIQYTWYLIRTYICHFTFICLYLSIFICMFMYLSERTYHYPYRYQLIQWYSDVVVMMLMAKEAYTTVPVSACPAWHMLYRAAPDRPFHHERLTVAPHVSPRCPLRENDRRRRTRRARGGGRHPPGDGSPSLLINNVKNEIHSSCEIEDFVETHLCKLCVILRSRALRVN